MSARGQFLPLSASGTETLGVRYFCSINFIFSPFFSAFLVLFIYLLYNGLYGFVEISYYYINNVYLQ